MAKPLAHLDTVTFARLAYDTYHPPCSTGNLGRDWVKLREVTDDNFLARAYRSVHSAKIGVVAFRGSANWKDFVIADAGAIGLSLNMIALKMNSALGFMYGMKTELDDCWLVGHSLGGAYVQLIAASCGLPGITFNAPGVLNLVNQMSSNPLVRFTGAIGGGAMSVLSLGLSDYFNKAVANMDDKGFQAVANFRGNMDPVSRVGSHVGVPLHTIDLMDQLPHPHSMEPIIRTLELRDVRIHQ